jgi:short-chain Z-isoprenyl diphosphate synthase
VGARKIVDLLDWADEAGVEVVTLFLLSTDNLGRPSEELEQLLEIIATAVEGLAAPDRRWRLRVVGNPDLVPPPTAERLAAAAASTEGRTGMQVNAAVGYGGRQEIADAVRKLLLRHAEAGTSIEELAEVLDVDHIAEHLYTSGQPDPDLVIRTSGEQRLSGFLMWQSVYSEFYFTEAFWPQFRRIDFLRALRDYSDRHRRYGG